jgi:hypothetical protein
MYIGLNVGSSYTKFASKSGVKSFPSLVGTLDLTEFSLVEQDVIAFPEHSVFVGNAAITQSALPYRRESRNWILSDEWYYLFLAALTEVSAATRLDVDIVTGLPLGFYSDRELLRARILGAHEVKRMGRSRQIFNIRTVRVIPETFGTHFYVTIDEAGRIQNDLMQKKVGYLDVGSKTTNFQAVQNMESITKESGTIDYGCWDIVRSLHGWMQNEFPRLQLAEHQVLAALTDRFIMYDGEKIDITSRVLMYSKNLRNAVDAAMSRFWEDNSGSFDAFFLTGGGYNIVEDIITNKFRQAKVVDDPFHANAIGMYRFAKYVEQHA